MAKGIGNIEEVEGIADPNAPKALDGAAVFVGLPADKIHEPSGLSVAVLGAIHEFGDPSSGIPKRSFLRGFADKERDAISFQLTSIAEEVVEGGDRFQLMEQFAEWAQGKAQEYFVSDSGWPPNKVATIKAKDGKATPLINTGELRQAVIGISKVMPGGGG